MSEDQVAWNVVGMEWEKCAFIELKMICCELFSRKFMSSVIIIIIIINFKSTVIIEEFLPILNYDCKILVINNLVLSTVLYFV